MAVPCGKERETTTTNVGDRNRDLPCNNRNACPLTIGEGIKSKEKNVIHMVHASQEVERGS
jgi:hypothetical protein